jgi:hypothetical protein
MVIKVRGILDFTQLILQRNINHNLKRVAIIKTDCELDSYYAWFLKKRFNLELKKP